MRKIEGYDNYFVTDNGMIWSTKGFGRWLKPQINSRGYVTYGLSKNNNKKWFSAHRLVALAFIRNIENKEEVNHIDGDKLNNKISNLEWCTRQENVSHAVCNNIYKVKGKEVINIESGIFFNSVKEAHRQSGLSCCYEHFLCTLKRKENNKTRFAFI